MKGFLWRCFFLSIIASALISLMYIPKCKALSTRANTINVFFWGDFIDDEVIALFEKETGIKVKKSTYGSNDELITKVKKSGGGYYDIICPSDYAIKRLWQEGYLKPIQKERLDFLHRMKPYLLNHQHDPLNKFSLPYMWDVYGIAIDKSIVSEPIENPSLAILFDKNMVKDKVIMSSEPDEVASLITYYLFGNIENPSEEQIRIITETLQTQRNWVEAYADQHAKYMISSHNCPIAMMRNSSVNQIERDSYQQNLGFYIPSDCMFTSLENIAITAKCENEEAVYKFINFLYRPEIMAKNVDLSGFFPSCFDAIEHTESMGSNYMKTLNEADKNPQFNFYGFITDSDLIRKIWITVRSQKPKN